MGTGILVCGLNGCGKSTLGEALAERLGYTWIDIEDCYFPKTDSRYPYAAPRSRKEAEQILRERIGQSDHFVLTAVKGDFADDIIAALEKVLWIRVPQEIRMQRVRKRSYEKFGPRMLPGGDLYEQEERFLLHAETRKEADVSAWVATVSCPLQIVDGTQPIAELLEQVCSGKCIIG